MPTTFLEELIEHKLQKGQSPCLSLHLEKQVAYQISFEAQLYIRQCRRPLNGCTQLVQLHGKDSLVMGFDQVVEFGIVHRTVIEISTQGQNHHHWTSRLGHSSHQQVDCLLALPFRGCLSE